MSRLRYVILCTFCLFCSSNETLLSRADALMKQGDYLRARELYESVLSRNPSHARARLGMGMSFSAEALYRTELGIAVPSDWYEALYHVTIASHGKKSSENDRSLAALHFNMGVGFRKAGRREEAIRRLENAVMYDSTLIKAYNLLGTMYHEAKQYASARQAYHKVIALDSAYALGHYNLGTLAWIQGDYADAFDHFSHAVSCDPQQELFLTWQQKARQRMEHN